MKKGIILLLMVVLATGMLFSGGQQEPAAATNAPEADVLKAALLTSAPVNDGGWNTLAYNGLLILRDEYGFEIANTESVQQSAQKSILRNYAKKGYDLIIGHGYEFGEAIMEVAPEFPDTAFYQVGGIALAENAGSAIFEEGVLSYLAGKLAAKFTKTNKIGFVGAAEIPSIVREVEIIQKIVPMFNPEATVSVAYTGSWTDVNKGKEAALAQINQGVDIIVAIGDACDFGAIKAAEESGTYIIGWTGDFNHLAPDTVLTSGFQSVTGLIVDQGIALKDGAWKAEHIIASVAAGYEYMATWSDIVPRELKDEIMADQQAIIDGELDPQDWL